jgi:hypothetical protein
MLVHIVKKKKPCGSFIPDILDSATVKLSIAGFYGGSQYESS